MSDSLVVEILTLEKEQVEDFLNFAASLQFKGTLCIVCNSPMLSENLVLTNGAIYVGDDIYAHKRCYYRMN